MLDKLESIEERYNEINELLGKPEVISDNNKFRDLSREHSHLSKGVQLLEKYRKALNNFDEASEILKTTEDPEMKEFANDEIVQLKEEIESLENEVRFFLIPPDPNSGKNIIMEIRAGTGGDESALFAADLFRMYTRYAESKNLKTDIMNSNNTGLGGFKEITFSIEGKTAYDLFRFEMGTHRVQRVPATESSGRIHTSAVTVALLIEAEESDVKIEENDLRIDVFRASGPGGQSVNTTDSAVRITHIPSGLVVSCQDEKSQHKNKAKALKVLRARLYEKIEKDRQKEISETRRAQVGTGDRSGRIRTYNFPENRITDHRIKLTLHKLEAILEGQMDELVNALDVSRREEQLANLAEE